MKNNKKYIILSCLLLLIISCYIFNDKLKLAINGYLPNNSEIVATGKTINNKKYQVIYNKNTKNLICLEKNSIGLWVTNGGYLKDKNCYSISWINAYNGESEYISVYVLTNTNKAIKIKDLSLPDNTNATINNISSKKCIITTTTRGKDITNINEYDVYSILSKKGFI